MFLLQAVILLAIAFILGAVVGCLVRTRFNERPESPVADARSAPAATPEPARAVAATETGGEETSAPKQDAKKEVKKKPARKAAAKAGSGAKKGAAAPDDLKRIKGVGRQIEAKLHAAGITRYEQIASWTKKDVAEWGEKLSFAGRIERDDWVAQAKRLAAGETTEFADRVAKGKVASSASRPKRGGGKSGG
ncbi:hypothetical protein [Oricola thermophila]|uniref:50S ribosomal protein L21 n=1 Tax=Oricola thermophila TaxID=2742145 RepID=A0A6N1VCB7_9HYPH|nr:hypothetical protein [Oricola thermophila]QKV18494.1 hypothetical protein HTY61_08525 [Oricola thermophila]